MLIEILVSLLVILIILLIVAGYLLNKASDDMGNSIEAYNKLLSQKKSSETRLGQISENLAPFLTGFKYDPKKAHFMGMPVDYIIFDENEVVFLEIKSGKAQLSTTQRKIKTLIQTGKVRWDEMRINDGVTSLSVPVTDVPETATETTVTPPTDVCI